MNVLVKKLSRQRRWSLCIFHVNILLINCQQIWTQEYKSGNFYLPYIENQLLKIPPVHRLVIWSRNFKQNLYTNSTFTKVPWVNGFSEYIFYSYRVYKLFADATYPQKLQMQQNAEKTAKLSDFLVMLKMETLN